MLAARHLEIVQNRHESSHQPRGRNGNVSLDAVTRLAVFGVPGCYSKGTVLFAEGHPSRGAFILCSGRVKLFTASSNGKVFILGFASAGEILGLAGTLAGQPYEAWAEATQRTETSFIERKDLVRLMRRQGEIAMQVAMQLGESYCEAIAGVRAMGRSRPANQKLAIFILDWSESNRPLDGDVGALFTLTHEEVSDVIGVSRETVTRALARFKSRGLIRWDGCNLILTDRAALRGLAAD
ncbi:MAG: Crp/Fnr family transcriptional regulator [Candidatus Acidiferrales bacterium]